jgi:hypothetical protein
MITNAFKAAVRTIVAATPIIQLLRAKTAVVLERIARGGGATKWYYCPDEAHLAAFEAQVSPGSAVSFYFDERVQSRNYSQEVNSAVLSIAAETGEAIIGVLNEDGLHIDVEFVTGVTELTEFVTTIGHNRKVYYGAFPTRENDGARAVTILIPDADGIMRNHPH